MTKAAMLKNVADRQLMLADKYERRSRASNSRPAAAKLKRLSDKYRRLAKQITAAL